MNIATLDWSLTVECPGCTYTMLLQCSAAGHDLDIASAMQPVECPMCGTKFKVDHVAQ